MVSSHNFFGVLHLEFGIYLRPAVDFDSMKQLAIYAEEHNYFGIFLNDHIHGFKSKGKEPYLEAWTTLSALGMLTTKIRLGHIVLFNSLRNPAYLAKSITTLDVLTNGRYEVLLGAGWNASEYEGYDLMEQGRGMPSAKERVDRLKESVQILKLMLHNEVSDYRGQFWKLQGAINIPQPVQKQMRISLGGSKDRMIRISAKYADGINVGAGIARTKLIIEKLKPELQKNNKKFKDFFISGFGTITIAQNDHEYDALVKDLATRTNKTVEEVNEDALIGTPEILIQKLNVLQKIGIKLYVFSIQPASTLSEMIEKFTFFERSVIPFLHS